MNWVDFLIILILVLSVVGGFKKGFLSTGLEFVFFFVGIAAAVAFYPSAAYVLNTWIRLPYGLANFVGFFLVSGLVNAVLAIVFHSVRKRVQQAVWKSSAWSVDRFFGVVPQLVISAVGLSFLAALLVSYPVSRPIKSAVERSRLGKPLAAYTQPYLRY